jgi:hypothetical protein
MMAMEYRPRRSAFRFGRWFVAIACGVVMTACTEEDPTDIGGALLPGDGVSTFEVILEPAQYLTFDTSFSGYLHAFQSNIVQVMRDFEGVTDANALFHFGVLLDEITVRDSAGVSRQDTLPRYPDGYLMLRIDSLASRGQATVGAYHTAQEWDAPSATWTLRIDTGTVQQPWTTPGGTRGALIGTAQWRPGTGVDSLMIPLDSIKIKALTDTANHARGLLLTLDQAGTGGASLRVTAAVMRVNTKSTIRPDTTFITTVESGGSFTFVSNPSPPGTTAGNMRVSGVPAWRGMLGMIENLGSLSVPCPGTGCTVPLRNTHVNLAELLLQPTGSPPGFSPEDSVMVGALTLLEIPDVPLGRSPLGVGQGTTRSSIPAQRFTNTDTGAPVGLPLTNYVGALIADTTTTAGQRVPRRLALMRCQRTINGLSCGSPQAGTFGIANFRANPRLRLVLTISTEQR